MNGGAVGTGEAIVFWVSGTLAVIGALGMVISRKAVHSALFIYVAVLLTISTCAYVVDVFLKNRRRSRQALLDVR